MRMSRAAVTRWRDQARDAARTERALMTRWAYIAMTWCAIAQAAGHRTARVCNAYWEVDAALRGGLAHNARRSKAHRTEPHCWRMSRRRLRPTAVLAALTAWTMWWRAFCHCAAAARSRSADSARWLPAAMSDSAPDPFIELWAGGTQDPTHTRALRRVWKVRCTHTLLHRAAPLGSRSAAQRRSDGKRKVPRLLQQRARSCVGLSRARAGR